MQAHVGSSCTCHPKALVGLGRAQVMEVLAEKAEGTLRHHRLRQTSRVAPASTHNYCYPHSLRHRLTASPGRISCLLRTLGSQRSANLRRVHQYHYLSFHPWSSPQVVPGRVSRSLQRIRSLSQHLRKSRVSSTRGSRNSSHARGRLKPPHPGSSWAR